MPAISAAELVRQELQGQEVEDGAGRAARLPNRGHLAEHVRDAEGEHQQAGEGRRGATA